MAKSKKSESSEKTGAKKPVGKKTAAKKQPQQLGNPMVDTSLAAQNAARFLSARLSNKASGSAGTRTESSMFRQMKEGLAKPHLAGLDEALDQSAPAESKKSNVPFSGGGMGDQVGHNQTFGADVTRSGVPRRTGG